MEMTKLPQVYSDWRIVRKIGQGSFGSVYEIERDLFGRNERAALKYISIPQNDSDIDELYGNGYDDASITEHFRGFLADIVWEYSLMAEIKGHTNIVYCDDIRYIQHDNGFGWDIYIKMELLTPMMKLPQDAAGADAALRLGKDICRALVLCEGKDIVHRDIKPQNIFVSDSGDYKLGDFGIARTMEHATQATVGVGTYGYMAPEVYNNQPYDKTVDIYSLGLVMYWLLNERRLPFLPLPPKTPKREEIELARIRRFSGKPLSAPKNGSAALKAIVLKACAYDPKQRYQSAAEMLNDLNAIDGGGTAAVSNPVADETHISTPEPVSDYDATMGPVFITPNTEPTAEKHANETDEDATVHVKYGARGISYAAQEEASAADDDPTVGPLFITHKPEPTSKTVDEDATVHVKYGASGIKYVAQEGISELDADATIGVQYGAQGIRLKTQEKANEADNDATIGPAWTTSDAKETVPANEALKEQQSAAAQAAKAKKSPLKKFLSVVAAAVGIIVIVIVIISLTIFNEKPAASVKPAATVKPMATVKPTATAKPTDTVKPAATAKPTATVKSTATATSTTAPAAVTWTLENGTLTVSGKGSFERDDLLDEHKAEITEVVIQDGITSIGKKVFSRYTRLARITIPDSVTSIGDNAFCYCGSLTSITIPDSIISIGNSTFQGCAYLTSITIPDSVTSIGKYVFSRCSGLTSISIPNSVTSIGNYAFSNCSGLTSITIPNSVTSIGNYAFSNCSGLTGITIPNSVTSIGDHAFYNCSGLTSITIPNNVTSIGDSAFYYCSGLTSITIPNRVTSIGDSTFYFCDSLTSITIPNSITRIGYYAFLGCSSLTEINYGGTREQWDKISKGSDWNYRTGNYTINCNSK